MNPVLQPVSDLLDAQGQKIAQLLSITPTVEYRDLEFLQWSLAPGSAANTGSTGPASTGVQSAPAVQCATRKLIPAGPYSNAYWYTKLGPQSSLVRHEQRGYFIFPTQADVAASQAVEFDLQQVISGWVYNWGFQFDYAESKFRVWNRMIKQWMDTGTTVSRPAPGTWVRCLFMVHRDGPSVHYDGAIISGLPIQLSQSFPAPQLQLDDMLNYGFQLDANKAGTPYQVAVYGQSLRGWSGA